MSYIKRYAAILLLATPLLSSTSASSKSYLDDRMTPAEIHAYLHMRMSQRPTHEVGSLARLLIRLCHQSEFAPETVLSLISAESGFDPNAISARGAIGLMQLMPDTAHYIARRYGLYYRRPQDLRNPRINLVIGIQYLAHLRDRFDTTREYLAAYNMGPAKFRRFQEQQGGGSAPTSVRRYVRAIQRGIFGVKRDARKVAAKFAHEAA